MSENKTITVSISQEECKFLFEVCKEYKFHVETEGARAAAAIVAITGLDFRNADNESMIMNMVDSVKKHYVESKQENMKLAQDLMCLFGAAKNGTVKES